MKAIRITDCSKVYSGSLALDSVTLNFADPGLVLLLGANGAGKSTLLKVLAGALLPSAGSVRTGTALCYLAQQPMLYPQLSAGENLEFFESLGLIDKLKVAGLSTAFALQGFLNKAVADLSEGQKMRIGLVRALASPEGSALLLDEPANSVDLSCAELFRENIKQLSRERIIILVTHSPESYFDFASRVIMLSQGRVSVDYRVADYAKENLISLFRAGLR